MSVMLGVVVLCVAALILWSMLHGGAPADTPPAGSAEQPPESTWEPAFGARPARPDVTTMPLPLVAPLRPADPAGPGAGRDPGPATAPGSTPASEPRAGRTRLFGIATIGTSGGHQHRGGYAVIGYATTGFAPMKDQLSAIAVLHLDREAALEGGHLLTLDTASDQRVPSAQATTESAAAGSAPFAAAAEHLLGLLAGRVVVAHHAAHLEEFLDAHLMGAGVLAPSMPALCTFTAAQSTFATPNHRLSTLTRHLRADLDPGDAVAAAHVTALLVPEILDRHGAALRYPFAAAGTSTLLTAPAPRARRSVIPATAVWVGDVLARSSALAREVNDHRVARYLDALTRVLARGAVATDEVRVLTGLMVAAGYGSADLRDIQHRFLESLRRAAFEQPRLRPAQLRALRMCATSLGVTGYFDDLLPSPTASAPGPGSFSRPVRKPLPPAPPSHLPRCGRCLAIGHYTSTCPRREIGPVSSIGPV